MGRRCMHAGRVRWGPLKDRHRLLLFTFCDTLLPLCAPVWQSPNPFGAGGGTPDASPNPFGGGGGGTPDPSPNPFGGGRGGTVPDASNPFGAGNSNPFGGSGAGSPPAAAAANPFGGGECECHLRCRHRFCPTFTGESFPQQQTRSPDHTEAILRRRRPRPGVRARLRRETGRAETRSLPPRTTLFKRTTTTRLTRFSMMKPEPLPCRRLPPR